MGSLDFLVTEIGNGLEGMAFTALRADLSASQPWTNLPIIKQIIDALLKYFINYLGTKGEDGSYALGALIITSQQGSAVKKALEDNLKAQMTGTDEEKKKSEDALIAAARALKFTNL